MAKSIKKSPSKPAKKAGVKTATTKSKGVKKTTSLSKGGAAKPKKAAKAVSKKKVSEKELLQKEANKIINSSPKKASRTSGAKSAKRPVKNATKDEATILVDAIVGGMQEKKAKNITIMDLHSIENRVCDYFVICDADSNTHVEAIAGSVEEMVKKVTGEKPYHSEGHGNAEWILIDYINVVVHLFQREIREFYNIEGLWADAETKTINS
jgi:ribosome-associated protein